MCVVASEELRCNILNSLWFHYRQHRKNLYISFLHIVMLLTHRSWWYWITEPKIENNLKQKEQQPAKVAVTVTMSTRRRKTKRNGEKKKQKKIDGWKERKKERNKGWIQRANNTNNNSNNCNTLVETALCVLGMILSQMSSEWVVCVCVCSVWNRSPSS